jgi:predicted small integral membrane protein
MIVRIAKVLLVMSMALLASLVSFGNLTDYGSNLAFVHHVFLMDTLFPGSTIRYRAISSPVLQNAGYIVIIALETATVANGSACGCRPRGTVKRAPSDFSPAFCSC